MSRATDAMTGFICALLDEACPIGGDYYREQFPETLETTSRTLVDLLVGIYPEVDNLHERTDNAPPPKYRAPVEWAQVTIKR